VYQLDHPFYLVQNTTYVFRLVLVSKFVIELLVYLVLVYSLIASGITLVVWLIVLHKIVNNRWSWCIGC
jgi:hypothetical protein